MISLYDKTVVLTGPFSLLLQTLAVRLTELGADVAIFTDDFKSATRVCQNLTDQREVNEKYGRSAAIDADLGKTQNYENIFSRAAELFGGVDAYLDTQLFHSKVPFDAENFTTETLSNPIGATTSNSKATVEATMTHPPKSTPTEAANFHSHFEAIQSMTNIATQFLKARSRTRILYLYHHLDELSPDPDIQIFFNSFHEFVRKMGAAQSVSNTSVNALGIGLSEEFLLTRMSGVKSIQVAQQALRVKVPQARLVEYNEIANFVSFLLSPMSSGLTGQFVNVNYGL